MNAIILAGGKGTRLRPLTVYTPKPVVPLANKPFLYYQIEILRLAGISDITLSLSYQPDKIEQILGDGSELGVRLRYITEPSPLGTGGAYRFAADGRTDPTVVLNGDILTNIDIGRMIGFHQEKGSSATLALMPVDDPSRYGLVETDDASRILRFLEKPKPEETASLTVNTINAGIYILEPSILELMPLGANRSFEYDVFPEISRRELPFFGYVMRDEYWRDIGTPDSYLTANNDLINDAIDGFDRPASGASDVATAAVVDKRSLLGDDCVIKPGANVLNSVLGNGVHIEEKAVVENSVIWSHSRVSSGARITDALVGRGCHIGRNAVIGPGSVLGDKTTLTDYTKT